VKTKNKKKIHGKKSLKSSALAEKMREEMSSKLNEEKKLKKMLEKIKKAKQDLRQEREKMEQASKQVSAQENDNGIQQTKMVEREGADTEFAVETNLDDSLPTSDSLPEWQRQLEDDTKRKMRLAKAVGNSRWLAEIKDDHTRELAKRKSSFRGKKTYDETFTGEANKEYLGRESKLVEQHSVTGHRAHTQVSGVENSRSGKGMSRYPQRHHESHGKKMRKRHTDPTSIVEDMAMRKASPKVVHLHSGARHKHLKISPSTKKNAPALNKVVHKSHKHIKLSTAKKQHASGARHVHHGQKKAKQAVLRKHYRHLRSYAGGALKRALETHLHALAPEEMQETIVAHKMKTKHGRRPM